VTPPARASSRRLAALLWVAALVVLAFLFHAGIGSSNLSLLDIAREILAGPSDKPSPNNTIIWSLRLPRSFACLLVGAVLGAAGSAFQALFRNPLSEPYTVGVSSGAAVGGVVAMVLGFSGWLEGLGTPVFAFVGGMLTLQLVFLLARRRGATDITTLLLAGVVVSALLSALLSFLVLASGRDTNQLIRWLAGSATPMFWNRVAILAIVAAIGVPILIRQAKGLNAFAVGEETAQRLGVDANRLKTTVLVTCTAMTATAVGTVGIVPFVGLAAPHIARRVFGVDWRVSLPGSLLIGAGLMILSDILAQRLIPQTELPVGLISALLGAPSLLILLRREG
jgi:iron complex transport system permease protein